MCGISGFYDIHGTVDVLKSMSNTMHHRGPDHQGMMTDMPVGLAHNRLSIIDLSDRANQPMRYRQYTIILNGEVYNHVELRKILRENGHQFQTSSDTEVIVAAYAEWGENCVHHFVGMWAFAIWDHIKKELFCSRDRFGIKPFYYIHQETRFYFGSEYKPLKKSPLFHTAINETQVLRGLKLGWSFYRDETYFTCIRRLPAAHNLFFDGKQLIIKRYWDISFREKLCMTVDEKRATFRKLFEESVRLHLRSDVNTGSCLSGGIDSSSIVSMISFMHPQQQLDTFTIYYDGNNEVDERPWVNEVVKKYPNVRPHYYKPSEDELAEAFEETNYYADVPIAGSSMLSQYFVMKLAARNEMKVLLDGQGADEYLSGYLHSFDRLIGDMLKRHQYAEAMRTFTRVRSTHHHTIRQTVLNAAKSLVARFNNEHDFYVYAYKYKYPSVTRDKNKSCPFLLDAINGSGKFDEFLYNLVFTTSLPTLLHFEDRNSMAFSIESRVPFLDHRLVEFAFALNDEDKISNGETKSILRQSLKGILPDAIFKRNDKKGFVTPGEDKWLRGPLRHLLEIDFSEYDFIDKKKVSEIIHDYKGGKSNGVLVWRLVALYHWLRTI
jgi:asparagine synthase (glutamine-hydrolysing)